MVVTRGRLGVAVLDSHTNLATHKTYSDWLPRQLEPATANDLLGLPTEHGSHFLQIANPGHDVVRAQIQVITSDTRFTPKGLAPVSVPAGASVSIALTKAVSQALPAKGQRRGHPERLRDEHGQPGEDHWCR